VFLCHRESQKLGLRLVFGMEKETNVGIKSKYHRKDFFFIDNGKSPKEAPWQGRKELRPPQISPPLMASGRSITQRHHSTAVGQFCGCAPWWNHSCRPIIRVCFFTSTIISGFELSASRQFTVVREECHTDGIREEHTIIPVPEVAAPAETAKNERVEIGNDIFAAQNVAQDIARIHQEGFKVDNDN
jgi:hypothetical protein